MKQLLLRVPDELHRRLAARAVRDGRSVNALATEILDAAADTDEGDRRDRLRARAVASGVLRESEAPALSDAERSQILASTKGMGQVIDRILDEDRNRV